MRTVLACALVAGAAMVGAPAAAAAPAGTPPPVNTVITLATGDRIAVTSHNGRLVGDPLGTGKAGFHEFPGANGDEYLIPASAQPYLGHGLDQSLFDLTALVRNGDTDRIPVNLSFTGPPAAPAGVTVTSVTGQTAAGYLTADSAAAFGAALRQRIGADVAAGRAPGTTAVFPGLAGISLAGAPGPSSVTPDYPLNRVEVDVTDLTGQPAGNADVFLLNTTAFSRLTAWLPLTNGVGRVEAPAGNYLLVAEFSDFDAGGNVTAERQVILEGLTVAAGTATTFAVSETAAGLPVTVSTPRPAAAARISDMYARTDPTGSQQVFGILANDGVPAYVNASTPASGSGYMFLSWFGTAPDGSYVYSAAFNDKTGIPADENFVVRPDQLATVAERLNDPAGTTGEGNITSDAVDPVLGEYNTVGALVNWGQVLTHYIGTADGGTWQLGAFAKMPVIFDAAPRTFTAGRNYTIEWGKEPLAPSLIPGNGNNISCAACVAGTTLNLSDDEVGDSDPSHSGYVIARPKSAEFALYQADTKVADSSSPDAVLTGIPLTHTTYREVLDQDWTGVSGFGLSTTSHTERTFSYDPNDPSLSTQGACAGWTASAPCQVLPVLSAHYDLAGLDLSGTSTDPVQRLELGIDHLSENGVGSNSPITSVTVSVSFDGTHWQPVPVSGWNGHYTACWPNPAAGARPAIQVTARDAAGNALSQTVTNAYLVGATK